MDEGSRNEWVLHNGGDVEKCGGGVRMLCSGGGIN